MFSPVSYASNQLNLGGGIYGTKDNDCVDEYKVMIKIKSSDSLLNNVTILSHSPQQIDLSLSSNWDPRPGSVGGAVKAGADMYGGLTGNGQQTAGLMGGALGGLASLGSITTGLTQYNKNLTAPLWSGGCELSIPLELEFHAYSDPRSEVWIPTMLLLATAAPYEILEVLGIPTGQLHAPGPTLLSEKTSAVIGDVIDIHVGNYLHFQNVIIENANATILSRIGKDGLPLATKVNITFRSYFCVTRQDLAKWFKLESLLNQANLMNTALAAAAMQEQRVMNSSGSDAVLA